jgi:tetratricopeptide (TPR) repeat protein
MRSRKHAVGLFVLLAIGTAVPALAQPAATSVYPECPANRVLSPDESEAAHAKYVAGRVDYDEGNYDSAITRFKEAYAKDCSKHEVLVIISRAYEQKGDRVEAINALQTFLNRVPKNYTDRDTYERRLRKLKEDLAAHPQTSSTAAPPTNGTATAPPTSTAPPPPPPAGGETRGHTVYPWLVVGGGVVLIITGAIIAATAPATPDNCDKAKEKCSVPVDPKTGVPVAPQCTGSNGPNCYDLDADQQKAGTAKSQPIIGYGFIAGGALAIGAGLVWFFLEPTGPSTSSAKNGPVVTPSVGKGYAGFTFGTSF